MSGKRCIFRIEPCQVTPEFKSLFNPADPASWRCHAVLEGVVHGTIFTDSLEKPSWGVVQEAASSRLFLGGTIHHACLRKLILRLRHQGKVLVGMWPNDERWQFLPKKADLSSLIIDFSDRMPSKITADSFQVPDGCELKRMDLTLLNRCARKDQYLAMFGSEQKVLKNGYGYCLVRQHFGLEPEVLCEAFAGPAAQGSIEIDTQTHASYRRKGYATLTCNQLISEMEQKGYHTLGMCAREDYASIALARKLGYKTEHGYRLMAWFNKDN